MKRLVVTVLSISVLLSVLLGQAKKTAPAHKAAAATSKKSGEPKFKAIWEPVNFNKDIELNSVAFVSALEGWVVGANGTILHTKDGGKAWEAQMGGDPSSTDRPLREVIFLDATHGWTRGAAEKLLRTSDGATWQEAGKISGHLRGLNFISADTGFVTDHHVQGSTILRTDDGGQAWKPVFQCVMDLQVNGLARKLPCGFRDVAFAGSNGYAVGGFFGVKDAVVARSKDSGNTWTLVKPDNMELEAAQVLFWDPTNGLITLKGGKTLITANGGDTWTPVVTPFGGEAPHYAMGGGKLGVIVHYNQIAYSLNGGHSYSARPFPVPAKPNAIAFPDAQHGYVVGQHGMVYRYVIVPMDYHVAGMIDAPAV